MLITSGSGRCMGTVDLTVFLVDSLAVMAGGKERCNDRNRNTGRCGQEEGVAA